MNETSYCAVKHDNVGDRNAAVLRSLSSQSTMETSTHSAWLVFTDDDGKTPTNDARAGQKWREKHATDAEGNTNRDNGACAPPLFASWQALLLNHHQMTHYQQIQL